MGTQSLAKLEHFFAQSKSKHSGFTSSAEFIASYVLRARKGQNQCSKILQPFIEDPLLKTLEIIRSSIFDDKIDQADLLLATVREFGDLKMEFQFDIERLRVTLFKGSWAEFDAVYKKMSNHLASQSPADQITVNQLSADSYFQRDNLVNAKSRIDRALLLISMAPKAHSSFQALAFAVAIESKSGHKAAALRNLKSLENLCDSLNDPEEFAFKKLLWLRAKAFFEREFIGQTELAQTLCEGLYLAEKLNHPRLYRKNRLELEQITSPPIINNVVVNLGTFDFFPNSELIIWHFPKKIIRLSKGSISHKILNHLVQAENFRMDCDELYKKVYGRDFHPLRHGPKLRVAISMLRKLLPEGVLSHKDHLISLR